MPDLLDGLYTVRERDREGLDLAPGWARRWTTTWKVSGAEVVCPVRDMGSFPTAGAEPVRRFSWSTRQRHRPGLFFAVSTGLHHGFESIAEQQLLLVLDFAARMQQVLSQPFRLRSPRVAGAAGAHIPDFLVVTVHGTWLIDVRPGDRIENDDRVKFAASAEAALACGWSYLVVMGWRAQVMTTLETLSAQRRALSDPCGVQDEILAAAGRGANTFAGVVEATSCPALARAHALHLIWHRRLGIDLARPLGDHAPIWAAREGSRR